MNHHYEVNQKPPNTHGGKARTTGGVDALLATARISPMDLPPGQAAECRHHRRVGIAEPLCPGDARNRFRPTEDTGVLPCPRLAGETGASIALSFVPGGSMSVARRPDRRRCSEGPQSPSHAVVLSSSFSSSPAGSIDSLSTLPRSVGVPQARDPNDSEP